MRSRKAEITTLKALLDALKEAKTRKSSQNMYVKELTRANGPISLNILKQYIDLAKELEGITRVAILYRLNQDKIYKNCYYKLVVRFAYKESNKTVYDYNSINGYEYDQITQEQYENSIVGRTAEVHKKSDIEINLDPVLPEDVETPEVVVENVAEEDNKNDSSMVLIHEKKTTTIQEERKVMVVNKPTEKLIRMVTENFFEFDKPTADSVKLSENAVNIIKSSETKYKNNLVEKSYFKLDQLFYYKDVIGITKYLLNRGGRYVIVSKEFQANTKYALPSICFTVFKKSYKKTKSNVFGFGLDEENEIKKFFEKLFHEYKTTLKTVSYIVYDYLKKGFFVFKNKTVKLHDIYDVARLNNIYNNDDDGKIIPEIGYPTFKACVKRAVNPDRLINVDSSDISYVYNYQTFKQLNTDCYFTFNKRQIVPVD